MQLRADSLVKTYKGRKVVKGVSIAVSSGEIVGLLGPNGAVAWVEQLDELVIENEPIEEYPILLHMGDLREDVAILTSISALVYILVGQGVFAYKLGLFEITGYEHGFPYFIPYILLPTLIQVLLNFFQKCSS